MSKQLSGTATKALAVAAATPVALFAAYSAVSHLYYRRSNIATASEVYNRVTSDKNRMADPIAWDNYILAHAESNEQRYSLPPLVGLRVSVEDSDFEGMQTFVLNRRNLNDRAVVYLHGTCFVNQPTIYHWRFLDSLARRTRAEVVAPIYPLAPVHSHDEAFAAIEGLYRSMVEKYGADSVTLMGDASGAGIAASFCQLLPELGLPQPERLVLISPWVDASLANPDVAAYEAADPMFALQGLRRIAHTWAKGLDINDPRVSPINGGVRMLRNVMVFTGTRELFHPDAVLFHQRVNAAGIHSELHVGSGLNANYPLYPIPEANRALEEIVSAVSMD